MKGRIESACNSSSWSNTNAQQEGWCNFSSWSDVHPAAAAWQVSSPISILDATRMSMGHPRGIHLTQTVLQANKDAGVHTDCPWLSYESTLGEIESYAYYGTASLFDIYLGRP